MLSWSCEKELSASGFQSKMRHTGGREPGGEAVTACGGLGVSPLPPLAQALFSMATQQRTGNEAQGMSVLWVGEGAQDQGCLPKSLLQKYCPSRQNHVWNRKRCLWRIVGKVCCLISHTFVDF